MENSCTARSFFEIFNSMDIKMNASSSVLSRNVQNYMIWGKKSKLRRNDETGTELVMVGITTQYIPLVLRVLHLTLQQSYHLQL
jgi:hypothetical protein